MKSGSLHRLLPFGLIVALLAGVVACSRTPQADVRLMDSAEAMMESAPDSALALMERVDSAAVRGRADRARYALLRSMALDRNYIDTTDLSILQPAIDYYPKHGTPDQRLKTRYYEGRIHMNRGDDDAAMTAFLEAAEDSTLVRDSLPLARLYMAMGTMNYRKFVMPAYINFNQRAKNIYYDANDSLKAYECNVRILEGAMLSEDSTLARRTISELQQFPEKYHSKEFPAYPVLLTSYLTFGPDEALRQTVARCDVDSLSDELKIATLLNVAMGYEKIGEFQNALKAVGEAENMIARNGCDMDDSIKWHAIAASVLKNNGMYLEALEEYEGYINDVTTRHDYMFNSGVLFTEERYNIEMDHIREQGRQQGIILLVFLAFLLSICVVLFLLYMTRSIKFKNQAREVERKKMNLSLNEVIESNRKLQFERDRKELARKEAENERYRIELEYQKAEMESQRLKILADELEIKLSSLELEKANLELVLKNRQDLPQTVEKIVSRRIDILDDFFREQITEDNRYGKNFRKLKEDIKKDKEKFLCYLRESFRLSHPGLISILEKKGLTEFEITYVCLLMLDISNKQIENYTEVKKIRDLAMVIRKKLGIPSNNSTLRMHLLNIVDEEHRER